MKDNIIRIVLTILSCICVLCVFCYAVEVSDNLSNEAMRVDENKCIQAEIVLDTNNVKDIKSIVQNMKNGGARIKEFVNEVSIEGRTYYGYYILPETEKYDEVIETYYEMYCCGLTDSINDLRERIPTIENLEAQNSAKNVLADYEKRLEMMTGEDILPISSIIIEGTDETISLLAAKEGEFKEVTEIVILK